MIHEQIKHKEKLEKEIADSMEVKGNLAKDLSSLETELLVKEQQRKTAANLNAKVCIFKKLLTKVITAIIYNIFFR